MEKEIKEIKDFKSTPYYEYYGKQIDEYCRQLLVEQMRTQWVEFDKKYSWNDVLKEVFKFINGDLRDFKDSLDMNPVKEEVDKNYEEKLDKEARQMLGMS